MRVVRGRVQNRIQKAGMVLVLLAPLLFLWQRCERSPAVLWIDQGPNGPWITAPAPVTAQLQQWGRREVPETTFRRRFQARPAGVPVVLRIRALRDAEVRINGTIVDGLQLASGDWKRERREDVTKLLVEGENELQVAVRNPLGPPLLAVWLGGIEPPVVSDTSWTAQRAGLPVIAAAVASDTRPHPSAAGGPQTLRSLRARARLLAGLFAASAVGCLAWRRLAGPRLRAALPRLALAGGLAGFAASVLAVYARVPVESGFGFDLGNHLAYVEFVRTRHALPLATDGWSMYHPPLYFIVSALLADTFAALLPAADPRSALRVLPFVSGLALIAEAWALSRILRPGDVRFSLLATAFASAAPVGLIMAVYPSNEAPQAALAGLALVWTVRALRADRAAPSEVLRIGAVFGVALLTKFTALAILPVAAFFLFWKMWIVERSSAASAVGRIFALAAAAAAVCGGWYVRNLLHFGRPIVANWGSLPGEAMAWWQQPGFHTTAYYLGFGASLDYPFFSGFRSFWDSLYSTFWADGYLGGRADVLLQPAVFDYELMAAVVLLAVPATAALAVGAVRALLRALRSPDPGERAALSFLLTAVWALAFAMLTMTLELPLVTQARAPYLLALLPALSALFASGLAPPGSRAAWPGGDAAACLLAGWVGALVGASWLSLAG